MTSLISSSYLFHLWCLNLCVIWFSGSRLRLPFFCTLPWAGDYDEDDDNDDVEMDEIKRNSNEASAVLSCIQTHVQVASCPVRIATFPVWLLYSSPISSSETGRQQLWQTYCRRVPSLINGVWFLGRLRWRYVISSKEINCLPIIWIIFIILD